MTIKEIIQQKNFRKWIRFDEYCLDIYVRKTFRPILSENIETIDLANFGVDPKEMGKGHFSRFLNEIETEADKTSIAIYVESILNDRLYQFLLKRGYNEHFIPRCLYRLPKTERIVK